VALGPIGKVMIIDSRLRLSRIMGSRAKIEFFASFLVLDVKLKYCKQDKMQFSGNQLIRF